MEKQNTRYFRMCGTCKYKEYGICKNEDSLLACDIVANTDTCDLWTDKKEVEGKRNSMASISAIMLGIRNEQSKSEKEHKEKETEDK